MAVAHAQKPGGIPSPGLLVFIGSFFILTAYSVSPTVYAGDSSLFSAASYHLGTAHHPAYPLLAALGKIFTFLPFGNIAFKTNLMSAFFGALTAALAYEAALYLTRHRALSLFAPLTIVSSPLFVLESSKAEAYSLNAALIMLVFLLGFRAVREKHCFREILLSFFLIGLGMGNHHTIGFMLPLFVLVLILRAKSLPLRTLPLAALFLLIGFSIHAYLPVRTAAGAYVNYSPVSSFKEFLDVFLRRGYSGGTVDAVSGVASNASGWLHAVRNSVALLHRNVPTLTLVLALAGFTLAHRDRKTLLYLLGSLVVWLPLAKMTMAAASPTPQKISIISPYYLQVIAIASVCAALGLSACRRLIQGRSSLVAHAAVAGLLLFQAVHVPMAVQRSSLSDYYIAHAWSMDTSKVLAPGSIFLVSGDNPAFLSFYSLGVERLRDDVLVMDSAPGSANYRLTIAPEWKYGELFPGFFDETYLPVSYLSSLARDKRIYASSFSSLHPKILERFDAKGRPLVFLLVPRGEDYPVQDNFLASFERIDYLPVVLGHKKDPMTAEINNHYAVTILQYAKILAERRDEQAETYFKLSFEIANPKTRFAVLKDYILYLTVEKGPEEARSYMKEMQTVAKDEHSLQVLEKLGTWYGEFDEDALLSAYKKKTYVLPSDSIGEDAADDEKAVYN